MCYGIFAVHNSGKSLAGGPITYLGRFLLLQMLMSVAVMTVPVSRSVLMLLGPTTVIASMGTGSMLIESHVYKVRCIEVNPLWMSSCMHCMYLFH